MAHHKAVPLFCVCLYELCARILVAFHGQFYQNTWRGPLSSDALDFHINHSFQACIAFSVLLFISAFVGIFLVYFNKKFLCVLYAILLACLIIGLVASTLAYVIEPNENDYTCNKNDYFRRLNQEGILDDDKALQWKETYYGGMILAALIIIFGGATIPVFIKHGH